MTKQKSTHQEAEDIFSILLIVCTNEDKDRENLNDEVVRDLIEILHKMKLNMMTAGRFNDMQ